MRIIIINTFFVGIVAGLFFAWTVSVMRGLAKVPDREFLTAMQSMNREILNPVFFIFFLGTAILFPIATFVSYRQLSAVSFRLVLFAALFYWIGIMVVTMAKNVPLNNMLDVFAIDPTAPDKMLSFRTRFEKPWNNWNLVRTISGAVSFFLMILACVKK